MLRYVPPEVNGLLSESGEGHLFKKIIKYFVDIFDAEMCWIQRPNLLFSKFPKVRDTELLQVGHKTRVTYIRQETSAAYSIQGTLHYHAHGIKI